MDQAAVRREIVLALVELDRPMAARELAAYCANKNRLDGTRWSILDTVGSEVRSMVEDGILLVDDYGFGGDGRFDYFAISDVLMSMSMAV